jgi:hypothetical protein
MNWPQHPVIYEINTLVWLNELSRKHRRPLTLGTIPALEWDAIAKPGIDAVWLMGVWERSPAGRSIAMENESLQEDFRRALPVLRSEDIAGSPYCIRSYMVDERLGGTAGLAAARKRLAERNLKLMLDLVPNHVAPDHAWVSEHPEYFIQGYGNDWSRDPASFFEANGKIFARGRDPYFAPWPDVLQLNAFDDGLRKAAIETLTSIAEQADGVRCDMAMLLLNEVFAKTWGARAGQQPSTEYWTTVISAVKKQFPQFIFAAEAYWDMEAKLQQQGFDYCYDKRLYDRLSHDNAESVRQHLLADISYQERLIRFIENHDEPRAAATFSIDKHKAAAVLMMTLPGAKLLHEGQFEGRKIRLPVFLVRRPEERAEPTLQDFYTKLLKAVSAKVFRNGQWSLCERTGWPDNRSFENLIASCWTGEKERYLVVVNLSATSSQATVKVPWQDLQGRKCQLTDTLSSEVYDRDGNDMQNSGLFVDLKPWAVHFFEVTSANVRTTAEPGRKRQLAAF